MPKDLWIPRGIDREEDDQLVAAFLNGGGEIIEVPVDFIAEKESETKVHLGAVYRKLRELDSKNE